MLTKKKKKWLYLVNDRVGMPRKSWIVSSPSTFHFVRTLLALLPLFPPFLLFILLVFILFFSICMYVYIYISLSFALVWIFSKLENLDRRPTSLGKLNLVRRWWNGIQLLVIRPGHDWKRMIESPKEREMTMRGWGWIIGMENGECEATKIRRVKLIADLITGFPLINPDKWFQPRGKTHSVPRYHSDLFLTLFVFILLMRSQLVA